MPEIFQKSYTPFAFKNRLSMLKYTIIGKDGGDKDETYLLERERAAGLYE